VDATRSDVIIIGAGILGLATAYRVLTRSPGLRVLVLEKESELGRHQSGHNSGVLHSGIYYRPGSSKARNCVRGYGLMLRFLEEAEIPHEICGKLIVATEPADVARLAVLEERAQANGLVGVRRLRHLDAIREIEPHVAGCEALFVPQAGIVDYRNVLKALHDRVVSRGGTVLFGRCVEAIRVTTAGVEVVSEGSAHVGRFLVGCAGLHSDRLARLSEPELPVRILPFRGEYYKLKAHARGLVRNLIYPVPNPEFPFLGVHFTRTAWGEIDAGPNAVLALKREGYARTDIDLFDAWETLTWPGFARMASRHWREGFAELARSWHKQRFVAALQKLVPEVKGEDLEPAGAGVRAQACDRDGRLLDDFHFRRPPRQLHVCNAPSPAATSSLSIGEAVADEVLAALAWA